MEENLGRSCGRSGSPQGDGLVVAGPCKARQFRRRPPCTLRLLGPKRAGPAVCCLRNPPFGDASVASSPTRSIAVRAPLHSIWQNSQIRSLFSTAMVFRLKRELFPDGEYDSECEYSSDSDDEMQNASPPSSPSPEEQLARFPDPTTPPNNRRSKIEGATRVQHHTPLTGGTMVDGKTPTTPRNSSPVRVVRPRPLSPMGILPAGGPPLGLCKTPAWHREALGKDLAGQELSCDYIQAQDRFFLFLQFALGGRIAPTYNGTLSPRGVFRVWSRASGTGEPWWVRMHTGGGQYRIVKRDWAIGRCLLMSKLPENTAIARDLTLWAQKFHDDPVALPAADLRWLTVDSPEDLEDVDTEY
uniref:Fungal-type protein kinase domain-containing protein n=1 Tax=Mycena chlorophos TaxID=658473 RepID=A0ABQ0LXJ9_MYCCL|nr:predicted protein [Mycena chlorophos]